MNGEIKTYIDTFEGVVKERLIVIYDIIKAQAPESTEEISYGMPAFKINNKPFVYFAAYKNHIGLYATPNTHAQFSEALKIYKQGKGSVQFPNNENFPIVLIKKMVLYKYKELTT
jgi:uncharacterized protein YdhG (YjbR/CyaY superfamily)